eukprot:2458523-Rhodomonas_salina.1
MIGYLEGLLRDTALLVAPQPVSVPDIAYHMRRTIGRRKTRTTYFSTGHSVSHVQDKRESYLLQPPQYLRRAR